MDVLDRIKEQVENNKVIIYMKGTPQMPQCGFSSRTAEALKQCGVEFAYVNILMDPEIFQNLPKFADWPTFPQVYINGEFVGGDMNEVIEHNTSKLTDEDRDALAAFFTRHNSAGG